MMLPGRPACAVVAVLVMLRGTPARAVGAAAAVAVLGMLPGTPARAVGQAQPTQVRANGRASSRAGGIGAPHRSQTP